MELNDAGEEMNPAPQGKKAAAKFFGWLSIIAFLLPSCLGFISTAIDYVYGNGVIPVNVELFWMIVGSISFFIVLPVSLLLYIIFIILD